MNQRIPLDHLTSDQLDHLYAELDRLTAELADYNQRVEQLEAALARVHHVAALIHAGAPWTANRTDTAARIRAAIAGPGTATAEETVPRALFDENARRHQAAVDRVDELLAAIERVRKVATAIRDATAAGRNDWQIGQHDCALTILAALTEPAPAATEATDTATTTRVFAALHQSAEQDVTRVIDLYERWVKAGPPPLGTILARWWDARLVELHDAIRPPADGTREQP